MYVRTVEGRAAYTNAAMKKGGPETRTALIFRPAEAT
jgi:hypothetical protein